MVWLESGRKSVLFLQQTILCIFWKIENLHCGVEWKIKWELIFLTYLLFIPNLFLRLGWLSKQSTRSDDMICYIARKEKQPNAHRQKIYRWLGHCQETKGLLCCAYVLCLLIFCGNLGGYLLVLIRPLRPGKEVDSGRSFYLLLQRLKKMSDYSITLLRLS